MDAPAFRSSFITRTHPLQSSFFAHDRVVSLHPQSPAFPPCRPQSSFTNTIQPRPPTNSDTRLCCSLLLSAFQTSDILILSGAWLKWSSGTSRIVVVVSRPVFNSEETGFHTEHVVHWRIGGDLAFEPESCIPGDHSCHFLHITSMYVWPGMY